MQATSSGCPPNTSPSASVGVAGAQGPAVADGGGRRGIPWAALVLCYFALFSGAFAFLVPPFEAPDEPGHLEHVNFLSKHRALTNQTVPERTALGEGHQPPLYYVLAAALVALSQPDAVVSVEASRNPEHLWNGGRRLEVPLFDHTRAEIFPDARDRFGFYLLRLTSVLLGLVNIYLLLALARKLIQDEHWAVFATFFAASLPQFAFLSGMINNDNLANLLTTLALYHAFTILEKPESSRSYGLLGTSLGLTLLTKKTILFLPVALALMLAFLFIRRSDLRARIFRNTGFLLIVFAAISLPLLIRNQLVYGEFLGFELEKRIHPFLVEEKSIFDPYFIHVLPVNLYRSFLAIFGWMNVAVHESIYRLYGFVAGASLVGLATTRLRSPAVAFAFLVIVSNLAGVVFFNLTFSQVQGRFVFPVLSMIAILVALGLRGLGDTILPSCLRRPVAATFVLALVAADALSLLATYAFYHSTPPAF